MMDNRTRRISKELQDIVKDVESKIRCEVVHEDISHLKATFQGPPDTAYEGGRYVLDIKIPDEYPFKPPLMRFDTKIWHPNISSQTGAICLDTIGSAWSPVLTIKSAVLSIQSLLTTPEPKDPQDAEVANMLINDPKKFWGIAHEWANKYAMAPRRNPDGVPESFRKSYIPTATEYSEIRARYDGYNRDLVRRFTGMGFDVETVVAAFIHVGIDRNDGMDYELEEAYMGDVTARLLGEP